MELWDVIRSLVDWVILPVAGGALVLNKKVNDLNTDTAVLKTRIDSQADLHDKTTGEMRRNFDSILGKLDNIEQFLRK